MRLERSRSQSNRSGQVVEVVPPPGQPVSYELRELFNEAYARLHGRMLDHAEHFLDGERARDAEADAVADVWYRWPLLTPAQRTDEYFFRAVHNSVLDVLRGSGSHVALEDAEEELDRQAARAMETITHRDTAADVLDLALAVMPSRRREVLLLVKEHGYSYLEVAELLGLSRGTINTHMRLATENLRTAFTRAGFKISDLQFNRLALPMGDATND